MAVDEGRSHPPKPPDPHDGGTEGNSSGAGDIFPMRRSNSNPTTSYANVVSAKASDSIPRPQYKPRFPAISLSARQVGSKEGSPAISFTGAEVDACAKRFQFSLIAKFTVGRPPIVDIQKALQAAWNIGGRATISSIWDARHFLIILDSEADVRIALSSPVHKIGHAFFRLFRWYPEYSPTKESKLSTVWVRLTGLPLSLYDSAFVEAIVSTFGYFVAVDDRTKACVAVQYARACVELDVTVPVPDSVWISLPNNNGFWQAIEVETKMSYCSKCRIHGHTLSSCRKAKKTGDIPEARGDKQVPIKNDAPKKHVPLGVATHVSADGDGKETWTEVTSKKGKAKRKDKGTNPMVSDKGKGIAGVSDGGKAQVPKPKHQPVRGVYVVRHQPAVKEVECEASDLNVLAMVPYVGPSQEACSSQNEEGPPTGSSCALDFNEDTGQLFHPAMVDHFNSIQEKAGSCSSHGEGPDMQYVTRRKKMLPTGSKHCLPDHA